jgi:hypothetical protein
LNHAGKGFRSQLDIRHGQIAVTLRLGTFPLQLIGNVIGQNLRIIPMDGHAVFKELG